jgi:hypothetical protein
MKTIILATVCCIAMVSCSPSAKEQIEQRDNPSASGGKSYFPKSDQYPYQGMPPMAIAPHDQRDGQLAMTTDAIFTRLMDNNATTWRDADAVFATMATNEAKQQLLAYVILSHKNLIADNSDFAIERKKYYIDLLAKGKYQGYCVLYYALKSLPASEKNFADEMAKTISDYAAKDAGVTVMKNFDLSVIANLKQRQKTADQKENFSYAEKFANWLGESTAMR